ncbi:DUF4190 domain-containing protein [Cryobacterium frigoriphilum]|uniref:DUF4190 domain-containing protein n=1 Tax=Cryobacterium frigoriphilum TaxID=1259150 RepID=A0A4R9A406_9MICO|nr:DUF4190 domain-containing protein [Cryobacterium frigoriphilum]TFD51681.1 DUF4190 domain-containing protein [Cryobacterium frigoriphilum]
MTDPNQPPVTPPSNPAPSNPAPAYGQPAAPPPAAPQYGQAPAYGAPVYGAPAPQPYGAPPAGPDKYNVLSIVSLVTAVLFLQLVAIITGHIALSQIKKTGEKGRGLALAGLIVGYAGIALGIIVAAITIPLYIELINDPRFVNEFNY